MTPYTFLAITLVFNTVFAVLFTYAAFADKNLYLRKTTITLALVLLILNGGSIAIALLA